MSGGTQRHDWSKLDNTAKIFPAVSGAPVPNVFRLYTVLKEDVNPETLSRALEMTLERVPAFRVKLRRGLFWYYLEDNARVPAIRQENDFPASPILRQNNKGFLFEVTYYKKRINLEVFHALADGTGAALFLNQLVFFYLTLQYPWEDFGPLPEEYQVPVQEQSEDGFKRYYSHDFPPEAASLDREVAYPVTGTLLPLGGLKVIEAAVPTQDIIALAKQYDATVTEYLVAELFYSIYQEYFCKNPQNRPIKISVPVNLRSYFPTRTVRNFFLFVRLSLSCYGREYTFEEILQEVHRQMRQQMTREQFLARIRYQVDLEKKVAFRLAPRPIKDMGLRLMYRLGERGYSCTFTNMGRVQLPDRVQSYVDRMGVLLAASRSNTLKIGLCSCGDRMVFNFASTLYETSVQRYFIRRLTQRGVAVEISCNEVSS